MNNIFSKIALTSFFSILSITAFADYTDIQNKIVTKINPNQEVNNGWQTSYYDHVSNWAYSDHHSKQDFIFISPSSYITSMESNFSCPDGSCGKATVQFSCHRKYRDYGGSRAMNRWVPKTSDDQIEFKENWYITFYYNVAESFGAKTINIINQSMITPNGTTISAPSGSGQKECFESVLNQKILPLNGQTL